jgi:hypothetical protein
LEQQPSGNHPSAQIDFSVRLIGLGDGLNGSFLTNALLDIVSSC